MRIVFEDATGSRAVAWEEQFGAREGMFSLAPNGSIVYTHPANERAWLAGETVAQFRSAAEAWNNYTNEVTSGPESEADAHVERLRLALNGAGVLVWGEDSLWSTLLEQADNGFL